MISTLLKTVFKTSLHSDLCLLFEIFSDVVTTYSENKTGNLATCDVTL